VALSHGSKVKALYGTGPYTEIPLEVLGDEGIASQEVRLFHVALRRAARKDVDAPHPTTHLTGITSGGEVAIRRLGH